MLDEMLNKISIEDKAAVFDALVRNFQGKAIFIHHVRSTKKVKTGANVEEIIYVDQPVYEFRLRVLGHDNYIEAILSLIQP